MSDSAPKRPLRLMYAAGPGDIIGTFRHWREGRDDPGQVAMTYSGQFYDVCRDLGAEGYAIASHPRREVVRDGPFRVEHRRIPFAKGPSSLYHLGQLLSALRMIASALRFRTDALVICDGTCHWFPLRVLPWLGVRVIPTIHCMFWPQSASPPGRVKRLLNRLDLSFWRRSARAVLSASSDITAQLDQLSRKQHAPVIGFLPTYRECTFEADPPPEPRNPFRVLFAGRIEGYKGVFDLLEIARQLRDAGRNEIEFDLCGTGSAIRELERRVHGLALRDRFRIHGHCDRPAMRQMFRQSHVLIVPTTTDFAEGFNQVVVEGVLAGRPIITSSVCPALDYVRDAVVEVPPDDIDAYRGAILRLLDDRDLYDQKRSACLSLQSQFYDGTRGWAAALRRAVAI
ncbi:MAG TPA: glycosyltransferase family 4 protein [Tepidisphaeraceae bacterium]|jgi:glycogen(starch) synthase|nr:glycosyltransferase family 4 protein [Tepidisphaeraceae bacterium]